MFIRHCVKAIALVSSIMSLAACGTAPAPPPPSLARPDAFIPLGINAPYLSADVIGGHKSRAARMRSAKIHALSTTAEAAYMAGLESELRRQTAGMGLDVLRIGNGIVIRIPAELTFAAGSSAVKPEFDATLLEISRTVKGSSQTYVDVFGHTDTSGTDAVNQALSDKRAAAVASYLGGHGVAKARIASKGLGESSPLYNPEADEAQKAANRRVEIRLLPYTG